MKQIYLSLALACVLNHTAVAGHPSGACAVQEDKPLPGSKPHFIRNYGSIRDTDGKVRNDILFWADLGSLRAYFFERGVSYVFLEALPHEKEAREREAHPCGVTPHRDSFRAYRMDAVFDGASQYTLLRPDRQGSARSEVSATGPSPSVECDALVYESVYPGIDAVFRITDSGLKHDWIVRSRSMFSDISIRYVGATRFETAAGDITVFTPLGRLVERAPVAFHSEDYGTDAAAAPSETPAFWVLEGETLRFDVPYRDRARTLVIDPLIEWSTYTGSSTTDFGTGTAIDPDGNVLLCGWTAGVDFPATPGALQELLAGKSDAFVAKFDPDGRRLWMTYLGGAEMDVAMGIAADQLGGIAVIGHTNSSDFHVSTGAFQPANRGLSDVFLTMLNPDGTMRWSTFVGGALNDEGGAVAVDSKGNILITGRTESGDFPSTLGSFQFTRAGYYDAYAGKFRPDGSRVWMTYYGGSASGPENGEDWGHSVAAGPNDEVIVCGHTNSPNFPVTTGAFQSLYRGNRDAFLVSFSATGTRLFATMLGGGAWDDAYGVTIDRHGAITVTGGVESGNFPVSPGAFQTARSGVTDAFIGRFDAAGSREWITLFGGNRHDFGYGISAYPSGNTMIIGKTNSPDLYVTGDAPQPNRAGSEHYDAFFLKMRPDGSPVWSTYFGGSNIEYGNENDGLGRIAADWRGTASASGWTASTDFPVTPGAFQSSISGGWDAFVTKIGCDIEAPSITADGLTSFCEGGSVQLEAAPGYVLYLWSTGDTTRSISVAAQGIYFVRAIDSNDCGAQSPDIVVNVFPLPVPLVQPSGPTTFCEGDSVTLDGGEGYASWRWSSGESTRFITVKTGGSYSVTVTDVNGCTGSSPEVVIRVNPRPSAAITADGPLEFCEGGSVRLDAGAGFDTYRWSTGEGTRSVSVTGSGVYTVRVTNEFGCDDESAPVVVTVFPLPAPVILALGDTVFCDGDSVVLDAGAGYTDYSWSNGERTRSIIVRASGTVGVTVTDTNGCSASARTVTITANPLPRPVVSALGATEFCEGGEVTLDAGAGFAAYLWSSGENTRTITVRRSGSYAVTTSFATGCNGRSDSIRVLVHPNPSPSISPDGPLAFCDGDSVTLSAPPGFARYRWSDGSSRPSIVVKQSGSYHVEVEDSNGCSGTSPALTATAHPLPVVPVITQRRDTLFSTTETAYQWNRNSLPLPGENGRILLIPSSGTYTVTVTNQFGCSAVSSPLPVSIALATVRLPEIEAAPGERIQIRLELTSSSDLAIAGARDFRTVLRFDDEILYPSGGGGTWSRQGPERVLTAEGRITDSIGTLISFDCIAMLGRTERVPLQIESFEWTSGAVRTSRIDGSFSLKICREGGDRLFDGTMRAFLAQNRPNPFNAQTTLSFELIESGPIRLSVLDVLGRSVAVLVEDDRDPGRYEAVFDSNDLPSGLYQAVLETGAIRLVRMMSLVK